MQESFDIKEYSYETLPQSSMILLIAKRKSGKTTWAKNMLSHMPSARSGIVIVMAGTVETKRSWMDWVHPLYIVDPSVEYLEKLKSTQNNNVQQCMDSGKEFDMSKKHITLIIDDCSSISALMKSDVFKYLASNGRHLFITLFITSQYLNAIPAEVRVQFDVIIILATGNRRNIAKLHEEYASCSTPREFRSVLSTCTENFGSLVIDNTINAMRISDNAFYGEIPIWPLPIVRLGASTVWEFADKHYVDPSRTKIRLPGSGDSSEDENIFLEEDAKNVLDNKRIFTDHRGRIVVTKLSKKI